VIKTVFTIWLIRSDYIVTYFYRLYCAITGCNALDVNINAKHSQSLYSED